VQQEGPILPLQNEQQCLYLVAWVEGPGAALKTTLAEIVVLFVAAA
jgi:hypothetical protein